MFSFLDPKSDDVYYPFLPWLGKLVALCTFKTRENHIVELIWEMQELLFMYELLFTGRGLLTANGKRWQRSRRLLTPAFHYDILRPYVKVYAEAVEETVGLWKEIPKGESVDVFPYMSQLTLDIMLRCTCSYSSNCQLSK